MTPKLVKLASNLHRLDLCVGSIWFSYETIVAFDPKEKRGLVLSQNLWGSTTGKHLNQIDRKSGGAGAYKTKHTERAAFEALFQRYFG